MGEVHSLINWKRGELSHGNVNIGLDAFAIIIALQLEETRELRLGQSSQTEES